jgi:hypothetical protein
MMADKPYVYDTIRDRGASCLLKRKMPEKSARLIGRPMQAERLLAKLENLVLSRAPISCVRAISTLLVGGADS